MKQIYKTLEVGEIIKEGDEVHENGKGWIKSSYFGPLHYGACRRQINVIEIPEIPAGFRPFTEKDYKENTKGEILVLGDTGWIKTPFHSSQTNYTKFQYIIKEEKKFSAENLKPGMRFRKPAKEEIIQTLGFAQKSVKFHGGEVVLIEELNNTYEVFDPETKEWSKCSDYVNK